MFCNLVLNYESMLQIDTNYGGTANWVTVAKGVKSITPSPNETVSQKQYSDGEGFAESHVTGGQFTVAVSCDRFLYDQAQDFVFSKLLKFGCERTTQARFVNALGEVKEGVCTIANIIPPNGEPNVEGDCSFEVHFNGKPTISPATTAPALTSTVSAGTVTGSTKFTATPTAGNTLGYVLTSVQPTNPVNALMYANVTGYVSDANIPAVEGQYLNMFEIDGNKRIVKYLGHLLVTADIG